MKKYNYTSYEEYLDVQVKTNTSRIPWTLDKAHVRAQDIENMKSLYVGRRCLCVGCRHDEEVEDFNRNGFQALGIDILPTTKQIQGDINKLENYFSENSFDIGYSCHSLEHTFDPIHFMQMIRKICLEGLYLVIPIRDYPDIEEPIFFDVMHSRKLEDLYELEAGLGKFVVIGSWIRDDPKLPSGAEMAFALRWK